MEKRAALLAVCLAVAMDGEAVQLYKSVTRDGRITYSDRPPEDPRGSTSIISVETRGNDVAAARPSIVQPREESENEKIIRRRPPEPDRSPVLAAERALEAARQALAAAQESSTPEDWIYLGGNGRAPRPEYLARLESLESRVKSAETALADAERKVRLGF